MASLTISPPAGGARQPDAMVLFHGIMAKLDAMVPTTFGGEMIIAATGYRGHRDGAFVRRALWATQEKFGVPLHVRVGDAMGADRFVLQWCEQNAVSHKVFRARWAELGKAAGPERNERMLQGQGDIVRQGPTELVLGFPRTDGMKITVPGSGTWGCLIRAAELGIRVEIPPYVQSGEL